MSQGLSLFIHGQRPREERNGVGVSKEQWARLRSIAKTTRTIGFALIAITVLNYTPVLTLHVVGTKGIAFLFSVVLSVLSMMGVNFFHLQYRHTLPRHR